MAFTADAEGGNKMKVFRVSTFDNNKNVYIVASNLFDAIKKANELFPIESKDEYRVAELLSEIENQRE
jgi:hypothetical protein